jgi:hypothetical protein
MKVKELEKEIRGQITILDKKELEKVLKFINQILNDPTI